MCSVGAHVLHHADTAVFVAHGPRADRNYGSARNTADAATP
jgi:hypothetical protein